MTAYTTSVRTAATKHRWKDAGGPALRSEVSCAKCGLCRRQVQKLDKRHRHQVTVTEYRWRDGEWFEGGALPVCIGGEP